MAASSPPPCLGAAAGCLPAEGKPGSPQAAGFPVRLSQREISAITAGQNFHSVSHKRKKIYNCIQAKRYSLSL